MATSFLKVGTLYEAGLEQLGCAILSEHLRTAALAFIRTYTPTYRAEEIQESILFIRGSALEATIITYGLPLDADTVRERFFSWTTRVRKSGGLEHPNNHGAGRGHPGLQGLFRSFLR